jgi:phage terminase large subunit-like protein
MLEQELTRRAAHRKLTDYRPYPKQAEFHAAGVSYRERLLMAGNQLGKTLSAGFETAMHLTGRYPEWWVGRTWDRPVVGWASGVTGESTRDNPQRILLGRPNAVGTGAIPKSAIVDTSSSRGLADAVDTITVRHGGGGDLQAGISTLQFKAYEKGREKWQGETLDFLWFDEEPPADIYTEGLTRTNATGGMTFVTFTPLLGMSEVVKRFILDKVPGTHVTTMTIDDAEHYSPQQRAAIISSYPSHERQARTKGIPQLGSGRVFPLDEDEIKVKPFEIPTHWPLIAALDFGWDHPSAGVKLAWDRDTDCVYCLAAHRQREQTPAMFAASVRPWGSNPDGTQWLPWAWPHDGLQHDKGSGEQLAQQYRAQGLRMLPMRATFEDGSFGVEAGVAQMLDRMQTGRLKVFENLNDWFEEFRLYHRKDGLIVKMSDDLMSATRYGLMMLRFAEVRAKQRQAGKMPQMGRPGGWMG